MKWNDLSMKDRATLILLGVASGVYDIGTIRDTYNEFAEGGDTNKNSIIKSRLRRNINPASSYGNAAKRVFNAVVLNKPDYTSDRDEYADAAWNLYLGFDSNDNTITESKYKPTIGNPNTKYYTYNDLILNHKINDVLGPEFTEDNNQYFVDSAVGLKIGDSEIWNKPPVLNDYTVSHGYDKEGDYISVYDIYDINPYKKKIKKGDLSFGIGKPFELYDRLYLDDYYNVPTQYRGGYYLPEVTVTPEKALGGPLIQKANKFEDGGELVNEVDTIPESDLHYTLRKIGRAALAGPIFSLFLPPLLRDTTFVLKNVLKESKNKTKSVDDNLLMQQDIIRRIKEVENSKTNPNGGYDAATGRWYPHDSVEGGAPTIAYGFKLNNGSKWTKLAKKLGYLTDELVEEALVDEAKRYSDNARIAYDAVYGDGAFNKLHYKSRSFLTDYEYNPGLKKFPKLMEGFYNGNIDTIRKEYKRYSNKRELGRNKSMALDIDSLAFGPYSIYK